MNTKGKKLAVTGVILQLGTLLGLIGYIIGMLSAFQKIGPEGVGDAEALANDISFALITTAIGLFIGLIGFVLMLIALFVFKYKAKWFLWLLSILSVLLIFRFPVGTIIGICLLAYLVTKVAKSRTEGSSRGAEGE